MRFRFEQADAAPVDVELADAFDDFPGIEPGAHIAAGYYERVGVDDDGTRVYRWVAASAYDRFTGPADDG